MERNKTKNHWTIWLTGLPGSGKSSIGKKLLEELKQKGVAVTLIELDAIRKTLVPVPKYTEEEREFVYKSLADMAKKSSEQINTIVDATAYKAKWRDYCREISTGKFYEVFVNCPLKVAIQRETERHSANHDMKKMYEQALERLQTGKTFQNLGNVIGVDVMYEEPKNAELTINSETSSIDNCAAQIVKMLDN